MNEECPHERVWRGDCCECGETVGWTSLSNVTDREGRTRQALRHYSLRLAASRWARRGKATRGTGL